MGRLHVLLLFVIFIVDYASSCKFDNDKQKFNCKSPFEISLDGTEDWKNVLLFSNSEMFNLNKNTFRKTPNLKTLSISNIASLEQGTFNGLTKLDRLVIFESDLEEIPPGILDDLPIRSIQIFNNKIKRFSSGFFNNLPDMREVDIRANQLKEIKAGLFNDTLIYKLLLDSNHLTSVENLAFANMESMIHLSLARNNLTTFNAKLLLGETNGLEQLWLNRNLLTKITKNMFETLDSLEKLFLEINHIETIEDGAFQHMPKLDFLDLSNNKLKEIQPKVFPKTGMKFLWYFFIHNNRLTFINNALFIKTPLLHYLSIGGNPFQCPCLDDTKDWTDKHNITRVCDDVYFSGERPVCLFTETEKNTCIYDVDLNEDLFGMYTEALKDYPELQQKCDTTKGIENAALNNK